MNLTPCGNYYEKPDGKRLPRVSRVLDTLGKPWIEKWEARLEREMVCEAAVTLYEQAVTAKATRLGFSMRLSDAIGKVRASEKAVQKAQDIGTRVHKAIQLELRKELGVKAGKAPTLEGEALNCWYQYQAWRASVHLAPVAVEQMVWNDKAGYAGQLDLLSRVNGELAVVDFKTSRAIYPEYELQAAAYAQAIGMVAGQPVARAFVVRLPKRAGDGFEAKEVEQLPETYEAFRNLLRVWKWVQSIKEVPQC